MRAKDYWNNLDPLLHVNTGDRRQNPPKLNYTLMPMQLMLTPNDPVIQQDIEAHGLRVKNPRYIDQDAFRIYIHTKTRKDMPYKYVKDPVNTGFQDYWMQPWELKQYKSGDCNSWAVDLATYLIAAGVPEWRVRVVVGRSAQEGHATVYVLRDNLKEWVHLNSTGPWPDPVRFNSIADNAGFKLFGNKNPDPLDIVPGTVKFCFNTVGCWGTFKGIVDKDTVFDGENMKTLYCNYFVSKSLPTANGEYWGALMVVNHSSDVTTANLQIHDFVTGALLKSMKIELGPNQSILYAKDAGPFGEFTGKRLRLYLDCPEQVLAETGTSRGDASFLVYAPMRELPFPK